jgi:hypothetical protein
LGGEQFDKAPVKIVESIGLANVLVEGDAKELSNYINFIDTAMKAVTDRNIDKSVLGGQRDGGFSPYFCQRVQTSTTTAP